MSDQGSFKLGGELVPTAQLPARISRLKEASAEIIDYSAEQANFLHSVMCLVGFPRRLPKDADGKPASSFERTSGGLSIRLDAGSLWNGKEWIKQPLPYGPKPRLLMVHISTEALKSNSREVEISSSANAFLTSIGFNTNGAAYKSLRTQTSALAASTLRLGMFDGEVSRTTKMDPIETFDAWGALKRDEAQQTLWNNRVILSEKFFETLKEHAVPLDPRALSALRESSLALDIYTWLASRLRRIPSEEGIEITWRALHEQFGQEFRSIPNFRFKFLRALWAVQAVYPKARVSEIDTGLLLQPSQPPIHSRAVYLRKLK